MTTNQPTICQRLLTSALLSLAVMLAACASGPPIDRTYSAQGQDSRVQFLILHYTYGDFNSSLKTLTQGPVSSHYLVNDNPPTVYQLVDESKRAFHAGVSHWGGRTSLNASSIGIEIVNCGERYKPDGQMVWCDYPEAQIDAVLALSKRIIKDHKIAPEHVLGHSDIAPGRKIDPGPKFPWKRFADAGLILWPAPERVAQRLPGYAQRLPDPAWFQEKLKIHGFAVPATGQYDKATKEALASLQMKYRQSQYDGAMDAETAAILDVLTEPKAKP
jgi:N-acetylmuramoyl-L-alanine amidase